MGSARVFKLSICIYFVIFLASVTNAQSDCGSRKLRLTVDVYDPKGSSESSRFRPSRRPSQGDRDIIDITRAPPPPSPPSPPPPPPSPPPPSPPPPIVNPSPSEPSDPPPQEPSPDQPPSGATPRDKMCQNKYIKNERAFAGAFIGPNYYNACKHRVNSVEECCLMCQGNGECQGYSYERADCSGFGGPINTGICVQVREAVVAFGAPGISGGSLNPFAQ